MSPRTVITLIVAGAVLMAWRAGVPGFVVWCACVVCAVMLGETDRRL
jgi:hypothetical protein